ncbi:MAG: beta strand repeat-containing protein, partial [Candidatus Kapaibacteriota bacterium]
MRKTYLISLLLFLIFALQANATAPSVQSRYIAFSNVGSTSADVSFTRGNGAGRIIVIHYGGTVDWNDFLTNYLTPLDVSGNFSNLTDANGNRSTAIGDADNVYSASSGTYVVIDILTGTQRTSSLTNLSANTNYNVRVFEYNISGTNADFNQNTATSNPRSFSTTNNITPPSGLTISQWSEGGMLSWTTDGTNAAGYLLTILQGGSPVSGYENVDIGKPSDKQYPIFGLSANTTYTYSIKSYDNNNNTSTAATGSWTTLTNPSLSPCPPTSYSPGHGTTVGIGGTVTITLTANNNQWGLIENTTTTINSVNRTSFTDNGNGTYTVVYTVQSGHTDIPDANDLPLSIDLKDGNGVAFATACTGTGNASNAPGIDANGPVVTNVTSTTGDGTYGIGSTINVQIQFNENVSFTPGTGQAQIELETGTTDRYATSSTFQSGNTYIDLTYNVHEGDVSSDLNYKATTSLTLTGSATIKDAVGNDANLTLPNPGGSNSLAGNKNIVIDGVRPYVTSINRQSPSNQCTNNNSVTFRVTFNEVVDDATVQISDFTLAYLSGSGAMISSVTPVAGAGNDDDEYDVVVDVSFVSTTAEIRLDFNGPVTDLALNNSTATFNSGQTYQIDHSYPTASITGTSGACYATAPTSVSGTASDSGCGGVSTVNVAIWVDLNNNGTFDGSDGYWNGTDWTSTSIGTNETFIASGTTSWSWTLPSLTSNNARYYVQVRATDGAGNTSTWSSQAGWYFVMDNTAPSIAAGTITAPASGACWKSGSHTIQWTTGNITDVNNFTINLDYSTDGG